MSNMEPLEHFTYTITQSTCFSHLISEFGKLLPKKYSRRNNLLIAKVIVENKIKFEMIYAISDVSRDFVVIQFKDDVEPALMALGVAADLPCSLELQVIGTYQKLASAHLAFLLNNVLT